MKTTGNGVRRWKRYAEHKDSRVEWLGEIPRHWEVKRLKYLADFIGGGTPSKDNLDFWNGNIPWVSPKDMKVGIIDDSEDHITENAVKSSSTRMVPAQSVLTVVRSGILKHSIPTAINSRPVALNQDMKAIVPRSRYLPGYISYFIMGRQKELLVEWHKQGATVDSLEFELMTNTAFPVPEPQEQRVITAFLDRETSKIDTLVAKKERLIELLCEKRAALISHAVTQGIDPKVPMKDSGVEWLGKIPGNWEVIQSKRVFRVRNEPADESDGQLTASQKYGMLLQTDFVEIEGRRVVATIKGTDSLRHVEPNDFVISLRSFQGGIEWCGLRGSVTFHYVVLKPVKAMNAAYFGFLLKSTAYIQALRSTTDFIRDGQDLRYSHFAQVPLPVVPLDEQAAIASFLHGATTKIDALIAKVREAIERLREYRTALISAAVTGKIDLREEVA